MGGSVGGGVAFGVSGALWAGAFVGALRARARIAPVKRYRRLRGLVPDLELVRRRAAGEPLRALASDYGVAHTTLGRHFARPQVKAQLREQARLLRLERRAARAERAAEQQLVQEVRRRAKQQAARERAEARRVAAVRAQIARRRPRARGAYARWLDERDLARPPTRAELHSQLDDIAAAVVAAGSGIEAIVEATDLRTRAKVFCSIDPAILIRALANDSAAAARTEPSRDRLRRLHPDPDLIRRRAAGEPLRQLAADYHVSHTTLARYFNRPDIARQLRAAHQLNRADHTKPHAQTHTPPS